jgi:hypothetical protein
LTETQPAAATGSAPAYRAKPSSRRVGTMTGEAVDILLAGLIKGHVTVTADEQDELRSLLVAMGMATDPVDTLSVAST